MQRKRGCSDIARERALRRSGRSVTRSILRASSTRSPSFETPHCARLDSCVSSVNDSVLRRCSGISLDSLRRRHSSSVTSRVSE